MTSSEHKPHSIADDVAFLREMIRSSRPRSGSEEAHDAWDDAIDRAYATLDRLVEQYGKLVHSADDWRRKALRLEEQLESLREMLTQITDPSYVGNYDDAQVVNIYRAWAHNALLESTPASPLKSESFQRALDKAESALSNPAMSQEDA